MTAAGMAVPGEPSPPGLRRRLAAFLYEGVLLFGVLVIADYLFASLTQQRHAMSNRGIGMAFLFVVLGVYFVWFWSHGGQTLAMKTWHIRIVRDDGTPLTQARAFARYVAAWMWFIPPLAVIGWIGVPILGGGGAFAIVSAYVIAYAMLAKLHPSRQFLHDVICKTKLVNAEPCR